jgi:type IV secretory pathway VirJ component
MKRAALIVSLIMAALAVVIAYAAHPLFTDLGPEQPTSNTAVVIVSGDMGFHTGLSPALAQRVADKGLHVVGVNSLRFAWRSQNPETISNLLQVAIIRALHNGKARKIVLVGQSYGADLVHVGAALLPDAIRRKIAGVILVVPTSDIYYRISPSEYFGWGTPDAQAIDTARQLDWVPLTCIYGREEPDSICPLMRAQNVRRIPLPGDHYLQHDPDLLFRAAWPVIRAAGLQR